MRSGEASPDQAPTIGPGEVARLIGVETTRAGEIAFFAAGEAAALTAATNVAAEELAADPAWTAICSVFGLSDAEPDLLALLVAVELDPGARPGGRLSARRQPPHPANAVDCGASCRTRACAFRRRRAERLAAREADRGGERGRACSAAPQTPARPWRRRCWPARSASSSCASTSPGWRQGISGFVH
jgi:hypothetical protein